MRLTNNLRDAFIRAAMDDVPSVDRTEEMRKLILDDYVSRLPSKVLGVWNDPKTRPYVHTVWYHGVGPSCSVPCIANDTANTLSAPVDKLVRSLKDDQDVDNKTRRTLRDKLHSVAYSCSTRKALVNALPEFEKYLPIYESAACRTLPAVANVVVDFVKAGWPKGRK